MSKGVYVLRQSQAKGDEGGQGDEWKCRVMTRVSECDGKGDGLGVTGWWWECMSLVWSALDRKY